MSCRSPRESALGRQSRGSEPQAARQAPDRTATVCGNIQPVSDVNFVPRKSLALSERLHAVQESDMTPEQKTVPRTTGKQLDEIMATLRRRQGLDISCYDRSFLEKSIENRRKAAVGETPATYLERLAEDDVEAEAFSRSLGITYSEFFRDPFVFALLEQRILPGLVAAKEKSGRGEIRVWSAGCAAGQEAWSVAILLEELTAARDPPLAYRIFATDLSEPDLALARSGVYNATAVGNIRLRHLNRCFSRQGDAFAIAAPIRTRVDFSLYDLLDASTVCPPVSIYGGFDLVFCCNVLLYYCPETQHLILDKIQRSLAPGGYLLTGETERQIVGSAGGFYAVASPANVFRKS